MQKIQFIEYNAYIKIHRIQFIEYIAYKFMNEIYIIGYNVYDTIHAYIHAYNKMHRKHCIT